MIPIKLVIAFLLLCPVLFWHDIIYLPNEHNCFIPLTHLCAIIWGAFTTYVIPFSCLSFIYLRITIFIRDQPNNVTLAVKRRQQRDLLVLRRILITVSILLVVGIPTIVLLMLALITGNTHPLSYRIVWIGAAICLTTLSIGLVFMDPQLNSIVMKKWRQNRAMPVGNILQAPIEMRSIATN